MRGREGARVLISDQKSSLPGSLDNILTPRPDPKPAKTRNPENSLSAVRSTAAPSAVDRTAGKKFPECETDQRLTGMTPTVDRSEQEIANRDDYEPDAHTNQNLSHMHTNIVLKTLIYTFYICMHKYIFD